MNFKTLLLGSAAAMIVAGGAQAADLTVAEPVDYVKVCDAFGSGFFYSPGTDTCIKVGGYVKFGTAFGDTDFGVYNGYYPTSNWSNFYTEASIQLTASSVTEFGNLTGFLDFRAQTGNTGNFSSSASQIVNSSTNSAYVDSAWLSVRTRRPTTSRRPMPSTASVSPSRSKTSVTVAPPRASMAS